MSRSGQRTHALAQLVERLGISDPDLARRVGVSVPTLLDWKGGQRPPRRDLERLREALGVDIRSLFAPRYHSVFLSYGGPDEGFAERLFLRLKRRGVDCFFFPKSSVPGERLHRTMFEGVSDHDRVVLVCSAAALERPGVLNEIEQVLAREAREGGAELLIPVTIDDHVFSSWEPAKPDIAQQVRDRVVADFRGAMTDRRVFDRCLRRLLQALAFSDTEQAEVDRVTSSAIDGNYERTDANSEAWLDLRCIGNGHVHVRGGAVWGTTSPRGPNTGDVDFVSELIRGTLTHEQSYPGRPYRLELTIHEGLLDAVETGDRPFGMNVSFAGSFSRVS